MKARRVTAAEYVRMSSDQQQFSIVNQQTAIREFAARKGFDVVRTYADPGRSGVRMNGRSGLGRLISDIVSQRAEYRAVLVYDISRWGRFQDIDEAAHYEYLCRSNGIAVHYCAEPFNNDGSPASELLKGLKRAMAAEYSRELGIKVFRGQRNLVRMGYKMGGVCGFGLRRLVVSNLGTPKGVLIDGEEKALKSDHVIQIQGPPEEIKLVRRLYRLALNTGSVNILRTLNEEGIKYSDGTNWTLNRINGVLRNRRYTGCNVWGRVSVGLSGKKRRVPETDWTIGPPTYKALVSRTLYDKVQAARKNRYTKGNRVPNQQLLDSVRRVLEREGKLSTLILRRSGLSLTRLYSRFGGVLPIYSMLGYACTTTVVERRARKALSLALRDEVITELQRLHGSRITIQNTTATGGKRKSVILDNKLLLTVQTTVCRRTATGLIWMVTPCAGDSAHPALICQVNPENARIDKYLLVRAIPFERTFGYRPGSIWVESAQPIASLQELPEAVYRMSSKPVSNA